MKSKGKLIGLLLALGLTNFVHAEEVTYVYTDVQGTPVMESDAQGNITARYDYRPYGSQVATLNTPSNEHGYTGHVNDADTGLVYMQARYYDPIMGRFLSVDPIEMQPGDIWSVNRFAYAANNPVANVDPSGMSACDNALSDGQDCQPKDDDDKKDEPQIPVPAGKSEPTVVVIATTLAIRLPGIWLIPRANPYLLGALLLVEDANSFNDLINDRHLCYGDYSCVRPLVMYNERGLWPLDKGAEEWARRHGKTLPMLGIRLTG